MKIVDMRNENCEYDFHIDKEIDYVTFKNYKYEVTYNQIQHVRKILNQISIKVPTTIQEMILGDKVNISICTFKKEVCTNKDLGYEIKNEGEYELDYINYTHEDFRDYEYIFRKVS